MPVQMVITVNAKDYMKSLSNLARPKLDQAVALALVDTVKSAKVQATKVIAKRTGLKSATVKERIYYDRVDVGDYEATVKSSKKPIPLIEFKVRETGTGVATTAWGKAQVIKGAFIATMRNGHTGVYRRKGKRRLPIEQLWGPTIGGTFATKEVQETIGKTMRDRLQKSLARRMASAARQKN